MASKGQHVQDNSVVERRLRPIYDWLDVGNNKKALQECEKVLKKTPNLHCAKALKALTLLRMGKDSECIALLDALTAETPTDDPTLQAMTMCCRELQQLDRLCKLFESALKLDPTNEELYTQQFMAYVRISDYKSQQQCAMNLYKQKPKNPYYCWAVMSIILQATRGEGKTDKKKYGLLLCLAERMMDKLIGDNKLEAEQEVQLYCMVLELQEKYEELLKVVDGPLGDKMVSTNLPQNRLKYLSKLGRWGEVNLGCKAILIESIDRWDFWKEYVNSMIELMKTSEANQINNHNDNHNHGDNEVDTVDDTPEKAHEFICRIIENGADNGYLLRGPYLARFELCSRLLKAKVDTTDLLGETMELFIEYFRRFGHKPCCVSDLMIYLNMLDQEKKSELSAKLMKDVGITSTSVPQSEEQMQRHICALQLSRLAGTHASLSSDHLKALVTALSLHYQHGYQTYSSELLPTDLGPSDPYALMAAHILYDLAQLEGACEPLVVAVVLLEGLLKNSPSNFHAKLLSIRLYHTIGGVLGAHNMYNSLDIKHLQLDSLGYIHCARLATTGLLSLCGNLYDTTLRFFSSNYKDSSDHLTFSYKFGSFLKLEEFMDFRERLDNSLHYTTVAVDRMILNLVQCPSAEALNSLGISMKDNKIDWDGVRGNYDLGVYTSWYPERAECPPECSPEIQKLFQQDVAFLKMRVHILVCLSSAQDVVKSSDATRKKHLDELERQQTAWETMHSQYSSDVMYTTPIKQNQVTMPLPSRIHMFLSSPYLAILSKMFRLLTNLAVEKANECTDLVAEIKMELDKLAKSIESTITVASDLLQTRIAREYVVNSVEILCISSLICLLCNDLVKPTQGKKSRRKANESSSRELLGRVVNELKGCVNSVTGLLQSWEPASEPVNDIKGKLDALQLNADGHSVFDVVAQSHLTALKDLQAVLKAKSKLLNGLG